LRDENRFGHRQQRIDCFKRYGVLPSGRLECSTRGALPGIDQVDPRRFPLKSARSMNLGFWNFYTLFSKNKLFLEGYTPVGDELAYTTVYLARRLRELGHDVSTLDMHDAGFYDQVFFLDYPTLFNKFYRELLARKHPNMHLMLCEPPIVRPDNYNPRKHAPFRTVLTWKQDLVKTDPQKYRLYHLANKLRVGVRSQIPFAKRKLCTIVNSFMYSSAPNELYSERIKAVRWFEAHAPGDFDLIGLDWDKPFFTGRLWIFNFPLRFAYRRIKLLKKIKTHRYPSFIGPNKKSKHLTLQDYRFCIAYENSVEPDYLSEKLFDSFFAGTVPIYLGEPSVEKLIPSGTFIDKRNFRTYDELYRYLSGMSEAEYDGYLTAIDSFVRSPGVHPYTAEGFAEMFIDYYIKQPHEQTQTGMENKQKR
jgi:hypothetical protein